MGSWTLLPTELVLSLESWFSKKNDSTIIPRSGDLFYQRLRSSDGFVQQRPHCRAYRLTRYTLISVSVSWHPGCSQSFSLYKADHISPGTLTSFRSWRKFWRIQRAESINQHRSQPTPTIQIAPGKMALPFTTYMTDNRATCSPCDIKFLYITSLLSEHHRSRVKTISMLVDHIPWHSAD